MGSMGTVFSAASITMNAYQKQQHTQQAALENKLAADSMESQAARKELEAEETLKLGKLRQTEEVIKGRQDIAKQKVTYAASGVKVNQGSALKVAADTAAWSEYSRQKVEYQVGLESWGLKYDAAQLRQDAANTRAGSTRGTGVQYALETGTKLAGLFS